jgi:hypothetical protein
MIELEILEWTAREILPATQADWLSKGMEILRWDFEQIGYKIPNEIPIFVEFPDKPTYLGVSIGWLGQCQWKNDVNGNPSYKILINPTLDGISALDVLTHEMVHAAVGSECGHGEQFYVIADAIGLDNTGVMAGAEEVLLKRLRDIQEILGPYPLVTDCVVVV